MKLDRNSFIVRVAYFMKYTRFHSDIPERTTLCKLFWLFWLKFFIVIPLVWIATKIFMPTMIYLFYGEKRERFYGDGSFLDLDFLNDRWVKAKHFPQWAYDAHLSPATLMFLLIGFIFFGTVIYNVIKICFAGLFIVPWALGVLAGVSLVGIICSLAIMGYRKLRKSEIWNMTHSWIAAKKQKICPVIYIK